MTPTRCGDCRWYEPTRNSDTGRVLTSRDGRCTYQVVWPALPKSYVFSGLQNRVSVWRDNDRPCSVFEAKTKPKRENLQARLLDYDT